MAERVYEGMYLLDANRYSRDPGNVSSRVQDMIEKAGGEILASRLWAEQKLAYPINGQRKGAYWLTYFRIDGANLNELKRAAQLNNDILRDLILAVDDRLVDALVTHAKSSGKAAPEKSAPAKPAADAPAAKEATETKSEGSVAVKDAPKEGSE